jgi:hypothetical protein
MGDVRVSRGCDDYGGWQHSLLERMEHSDNGV